MSGEGLDEPGFEVEPDEVEVIVEPDPVEGVEDPDAVVADAEVVGEEDGDPTVEPVVGETGDILVEAPGPLEDATDPDVEAEGELLGEADADPEGDPADGEGLVGGDFALDEAGEVAAEAAAEAADDFVDDPDTDPDAPVLDEDTGLVLDADGVVDLDGSDVDPTKLWEKFEVEGTEATEQEALSGEYVESPEDVLRAWEPLGEMDAEGEGLFGGLEPGSAWLIRVRGASESQVSEWSPPVVVVVPKDNVPPAQPAPLTLTGVHGGVDWYWPGTLATGAPLPEDFSYAEIRSVASGGLVQRVQPGESGHVRELALDPVSLYVVAVDVSGNMSTPSVAATATPLSLVDEAGIAGAIGDVADRAEQVLAEARQDIAELDESIAVKAVTAARGMFYAPNLLPGMEYFNIHGWNNDGTSAPDTTMGEPRPGLIEDYPPFGINNSHPSFWIEQGANLNEEGNIRTNFRTSDNHPFHLNAGEEYEFFVEDKGSIANTSYYIQVVHQGTNDSASGMVVNGRETTYLLADVRTAAGQAWTERRGIYFTVPSTGLYQLLIYPHHHYGAQAEGGHQWWKNMTLRSRLDGSIFAENLITAKSIVASEDLAAKVARFLHLAVDQLNANEIWSNTAWLGAARFRSVTAGYETVVDSQGLGVWHLPGSSAEDGDKVPVVQLGGSAENTFSTYKAGDVTATIGADGAASFASVASEEDIQVAGNDLLGSLIGAEIPGQDSSSILSPLPRGVVARGSRDMSGASYSSPTHVGFLEVAFDSQWGRAYRVNIDPYGMATDKTYFQRVMVTYDGSSPNWSNYSASFVNAIRNGLGGGGVFHLQPANTGVARVLLGVYTGGAGITFGGSGLSKAHMWVEDIGSRVENTGIDRGATIIPSSSGGSSGGSTDSKPTKKSYLSAWRPSWMRSFYNGGSSQQVTGMGSTMVKQGRDKYWSGGGIQTGLFGGFTTGAIAGESGKSIASALSGATVTSVSIQLRAEYVPGGGSATARLHWHTTKSAPGSYTSTTGRIGDYKLTQGASRKITLSGSTLTSVASALKAGTFGGFGLTPRGSTSQTYALGVSWKVRPVLRIGYSR